MCCGSRWTISPVNLLLKQRLVPELLQDELTAEALVERALPPH